MRILADRLVGAGIQQSNVPERVVELLSLAAQVTGSGGNDSRIWQRWNESITRAPIPVLLMLVGDLGNKIPVFASALVVDSKKAEMAEFGERYKALREQVLAVIATKNAESINVTMRELENTTTKLNTRMLFATWVGVAIAAIGTVLALSQAAPIVIELWKDDLGSSATSAQTAPARETTAPAPGMQAPATKP